MKDFKELNKCAVNEVEKSILKEWMKQDILNKTIENRLIVNENVKYSKSESKVTLVNDVIYGDFGVELTPEKTARLGAALGTLSGGVRVGVGVDGELNSIALKYGLLSGLISVGAKTFDFGNSFYSQMFYYSIFCDVDIAVFINGGENGVSLSFCEKHKIWFSKLYYTIL